jgi:predicted nuclease of predicted toxin-antitoxin system
MLRLVSDASVDGPIIDGLFRRQPDLDLVRAEDVGLRTADDPMVLAWAAANSRIAVTQDEKTFPWFAYDRVGQGESMPGVFLVPKRV